MLESIVFFKAFGILLVCLGCFFSGGYIVLRLMHRKGGTDSWWTMYLSLITGVYLLVSLYAIIQTGGVTVMLPIPLLILLLLYNYRRSAASPVIFEGKRSNMFSALYLLLSATVYFLFYAWIFLKSGASFQYAGGDVAYYARVAEHLNAFGRENNHIGYLFPEKTLVSFYHYGDIWPTAFVHGIFGITPIVAAMLVVYPLLMTIICAGSAALVHSIVGGTKNGWLVFVTVVVGFIGGKSFLFPSFLFSGTVDIYSRALADFPKALLLGCNIPLILYCVWTQRTWALLIASIIAAVTFVNAMPALLVGTGLWILWKGFQKGNLAKTLLMLAIAAVSTAGFFFLLYGVYPKYAASGDPASATIQIAKMPFHLKTAINIFGGGVLQFSVFAPILVLFLFLIVTSRSKRQQPDYAAPVVFTVLLIVVGLGTWAATYAYTPEAVQFFGNIFIACGGIVVLWVIAWALKKNGNPIVRWAALALLIFFIWGNIRYTFHVESVPRKEYREVISFIGDRRAPLFAFYREEHEYLRSFFSSKTEIYPPYPFLVYSVPRYDNYSLNIIYAQPDSTLPDFSFRKANIENAPVAYYARKRGIGDIPAKDLMSRFMKDYNIDFLSAPIYTAVPDFLKEGVVDSLYSEQIGWKLYKYNRK
jgi:hypothetical protein